MSWRNDLAAYLRGQASALPAVSAKRDQLAGAVLEQPESAAAWWTLLEHEVWHLPCPALLCPALPRDMLPVSMLTFSMSARGAFGHVAAL